jgi:pre-mRNA cleavage complex 2 protein Pcf11
MQILLDEVQNTSEVDELDKVSLERLAEINPDLLQQIKAEAEIVLMEQKQQQTMQSSQMPPVGAANIACQQPTLSDWSKLKLDHLEKSHSIVSCLQRHIRMGSRETTVARSQCDSTIHLYAAVSASAQLLTDMLHQWKLSQSEQQDASSSVNLDNQKRKRRYSLVKKEKFTTEGVKERNDAVIARLYEVGLPFVCSADGRRFATQLELSKHLDALFRKRWVTDNLSVKTIFFASIRV